MNRVQKKNWADLLVSLDSSVQGREAKWPHTLSWYGWYIFLPHSAFQWFTTFRILMWNRQAKTISSPENSSHFIYGMFLTTVATRSLVVLKGRFLCLYVSKPRGKDAWISGQPLYWPHSSHSPLVYGSTFTTRSYWHVRRELDMYPIT